MTQNWICNHLGARAHYEIPKALTRKGALKYLLTDFWAYPGAVPDAFQSYPLFKKLAQRRASLIADDRVHACNVWSLCFELGEKISKRQGWELITRRNGWYQNRVVSMLGGLDIDQNDVFFSFAYTGLNPMRHIRDKISNIILYQMDPGIYEEELVREEYNRIGLINTDWKPAPKSYWEQWREECALSDEIMVNSAWSAEALAKAGVDRAKLSIVPLPYTIPDKAFDFNRIYPERFDRDRPLRLLFLGTLTVRKGFHRVLELASRLTKEPIEFILVGQKEYAFDVPANVRYYPHVSREETAAFYQSTDVFLFPTLSDGFGLTQLEAMSWQLPVISSRFCGEVVEDGKNGWILKENSVEEMVDLLMALLKDPGLLARHGEECLARVQWFNHDRFAESMLAIASQIKK